MTKPVTLLIDEAILRRDDALLTANGYVNAARLILRALQDQTRGDYVDNGLHALQLVVDGAGDMIDSAIGDIEEIESLTGGSIPTAPVDIGEN